MRAPNSARSSLVRLLIALPVLLLASPAFAESFVDVTAGIAFNSDIGDGDPSDSVSGGVRIGHYFSGIPFLGLALDATYFGPETEGVNEANLVEVRAVPVSALLMARLPLGETDETPGGRIAPYVGVGPSLFIADWHSPVTGTGDTEVTIGVDVRTGVAWQFMEGFSLLTEYRFGYAEVEVGNGPVESDLNLLSHHLLVGVRLAF